MRKAPAPVGTLPLLLLLGCAFTFAAQSATAAEPIKFCATGTITMGSFAEHIETLRKSNRYEPADIDKLIADQRAGGPQFFSSQVVIKQEQSGSGDFDLNLFQGFSDPHTKYKSEKPWACEAEDYPVVYFVGFKVREINKNSISVSRENDAVNVVSLKRIDPELDKHARIIDSQTGAVLCKDIAVGCVKQIFYGQW
jgi:hypothetical protein